MAKEKKHPLECIRNHFYNDNKISDFVKGYMAGYTDAILFFKELQK
jgi:hypothetical protein